MWRFLTVAVVAAALLVAACGGSVDAGAGKGGQGTTGTPVTTVVPSPAADGSLTAAQVKAVAEQVFPEVQPFGYYGVCGLTGDTSQCPYTERLKARLGELRDTLARAQNPSGTREVTAEVTGASSGVAHVVLFGGRQAMDLNVVVRDGRVLVDDETCAGRAETSVYSGFGAC